MKDVDLLLFSWVGLFVAISLVIAGTVVYFGRKKGYIPNLVGIVMVPSFVISSALLLWFFCLNSSAVSAYELAFVTISSLVMVMLGFCNNKRLIRGFIVAAVAVSFALLPSGSFDYPLPYLCMAVAAIIWILFIYSQFKMNEVDGLVISEGTFISFAVFAECCLLELLVATGNLAAIGLMALAFAAALFSFKNWNTYPAKIKLKADTLLAVGFVLGWILMKMAAGGSWMFALMVPSVFVLEASYALLKKVLLKQREAVTFAVAAARRGSYHNLIVKLIFKANLVILVFAIIPPRSPSGVLFLVMGLLWAIWAMDRLRRFGQPEPTIREITKGIFGEFKKALDMQKSYYAVLSENFKKSGNFKEAVEATKNQFAEKEVAAVAGNVIGDESKPDVANVPKSGKKSASKNKKGKDKALDVAAVVDKAASDVADNNADGDSLPEKPKKKKATKKKATSKVKTGNPAQRSKKSSARTKKKASE